MSIQPVLINGQWTTSAGGKSFQATNPATKRPLPPEFPVSPWSEVESALQAANRAFEQIRQWPGARFASFLEAYADGIEADAERCRELLDRSTAVATALSPYIGYAATAEVAKESVRTGTPIREIVLARGLLDAATADRVLAASAMTEPGIAGKK